jgi:hypothetical protein
MQLQTYLQSDFWKDGDQLILSDIVDKETAHEKDLLHLSAHLLILDPQKRILSRHRKVDDFRYADTWTSSIGTHVLAGDDYLSTLTPLLPLKKVTSFFGEFRVHDPYENEVNGLYLMEVEEDELPTDFLADKQFFNREELMELINDSKTTHHLKAAVELLESKGFWG